MRGTMAAIRGAAFALALALAGCATPLDARAPRGFDLTGVWALDEARSDSPPDLGAIRRQQDRDLVRGRSAEPSSSAAFLVQDFPVLAATRLRIEQDAESMGVRYDRDVYRDISFGERQRDFWTVYAGWRSGALVVRSKRDGVVGTQTHALEDHGGTLRITVQVEGLGKDVQSVRVYRRR